MSAFVLILVMTWASGTTTSTIDMPDKATCGREAALAMNHPSSVRQAYCLDRRPDNSQ